MSPESAANNRGQRAQHMLRRVLGASPDVVCVYHVRSRRIAFLGHRTRDVLGFAAARSQRLKVEEFERLVHPADRADLRRHLAAIEGAAEGEILSQELRIKGADGCYRWLRVRDTVLACTETGAVAKVVGVVTNIDECRCANAEPALPAADGRLGNILATIGDCYIALDRRYCIVDVNSKAEAWLRTSRADIVGRSYLELIGPTADHAEAVPHRERRAQVRALAGGLARAADPSLEGRGQRLLPRHHRA
jgi:PAS domain-containing protein